MDQNALLLLNLLVDQLAKPKEIGNDVTIMLPRDVNVLWLFASWTLCIC